MARRWIGDVAVLVVVLVTGRLGVWQLSRYQERSAIAEQREVRHAEPPVERLEAPWEALDDRRIALDGRYTDAAVVTGGIPFRLNGYAAVGVFAVDDGPRVLVLRGWVPNEGWTRFLETPADTHIEGVVQPLTGADDVEPITDPRSGAPLWPQGRQSFLGVFSRGAGIPWPSLARAHGIDTPVVVVVGPRLESLEDRSTQVLPAGGYTTYLKTFHHLEYALQWFAFGLIAVGLRWWFGWRRRSAEG